MTANGATRPIPGSYSEMYPSRFLKADAFKGRKVTLTIKAIFGEDLISAEDEATKPEWIVQFAERPLEWVMNKTNAFCLYRMFGGDPHTWIGRRITLYPQPGKWFGERTEAIRVWGSPELTEDLPITLKFLRKKADRNMTMHRVGLAGPAVNGASVPAADPVQAATVTPDSHSPYWDYFEKLEWTVPEQAEYLGKMEKFTEKQIKADLNRLIDERNASE